MFVSLVTKVALRFIFLRWLKDRSVNRLLSMLSIIAVILTCAVSDSQILNWKSPIDGSFSDPNNWLPNNEPNSSSETPTFDLFGTYAVNFDQPIGSSLNELEVTRGTVRYFSSTNDQTLAIDNDVRLDSATLELDRKTSPGDLHLTVGGELSLANGALLHSLEQSSVTANSTVVGTGTNSDATELRFDDEATANLGNTFISNTGNGTFDGLLSVFNNAVANVDDLEIATSGQANRKGAVQVFSGGTLQQLSGLTTIGANSTEGQATLFAGFGGQFMGDAIHVLRNGNITNSGGHVAFETSLVIDGGSYLESGNATLTIGSNASVDLQNGASLTLVNSAWQVNTGQSINVEESQLISTETIQLTGGILTAAGSTSTIDAPLTVESNGSLIVSANSTVQFTSPVTNNDGTINVESGAIAEFENTYQGLGTLGAGATRFLGDVAPGMSPGIVTFNGDVEWADSARLLVELGGTTSGSWDQTIVGGNALLDGELVVELLDLGSGLYQPTPGDTFQIIQASSTTGQFETASLPALASESRWVINYLPQGVLLLVVSEGDYNGDGRVDAADYAVWRNQLGQIGQNLAADGNNDGVVSELDYDTWVNNYGSTSNLSASAIRASFDGIDAQSVPEPYSLVMIAFVGLGALLRDPNRQR